MARATRKRLGWGLLALGCSRGCSSGSSSSAGGGTPDPTDPEHPPQPPRRRRSTAASSCCARGWRRSWCWPCSPRACAGDNSAYRKPLALGGATALAAAVATWFIAIAITDAVGPGSLDLQAATGLLAIAVLLVVMNWFFHKVYWTGWIASHNRRRKALMGEAGSVERASARCSAWRCSASPRCTARASRSSCSSRTCACATARAWCSRASPLGLVFVGRDRLADLRPAAPAALPEDAGGDRRHARRRAAGDGRRERPGAPAGRLDRAPPRSTSPSPAGWACGSRSSPTCRRSWPRRWRRSWWSAPTSWPRSSRSAARGGGGRAAEPPSGRRARRGSVALRRGRRDRLARQSEQSRRAPGSAPGAARRRVDPD